MQSAVCLGGFRVELLGSSSWGRCGWTVEWLCEFPACHGAGPSEGIRGLQGWHGGPKKNGITFFTESMFLFFLVLISSHFCNESIPMLSLLTESVGIVIRWVFKLLAMQSQASAGKVRLGTFVPLGWKKHSNQQAGGGGGILPWAPQHASLLWWRYGAFWRWFDLTTTMLVLYTASRLKFSERVDSWALWIFKYNKILKSWNKSQDNLYLKSMCQTIFADFWW